MPETSPGSSTDAVAMSELEADDQPGVLSLLGEVFGTWPGQIENVDPSEFFDWKHRDCPFGKSIMLVGKAGGRPVAFGGYLRWRLRARGRDIEALRGVDFVVHPSYRGHGIQVALTKAAAPHFPAEIELTFSTPNQRSRPGALKAGRRQVGRLHNFVRLGRPLPAIARRITTSGSGSRQPPADAEPATDALADSDGVAALLGAIGQPSDQLTTARDLDFLRWRYGGFEDYRAVRIERDGGLAGLAIFRVRRHGRAWMSRVCELLVAGSEPRVARRLLSRVSGAAAVDFVTCAFPSRLAAARCGFVEPPSGMPLLAQPLLGQLPVDPTRISSWGLSLGDQELL